MAISQKLHTKLVQKLILTPSLQQAIKLLPMSTLELSDLLNQEMVENPLLEESADRGAAAGRRRRRSEKAEAEQPEADKSDTWDDSDYEYFFGDYLDDGYRPHAPQEVKELPPIENTLSTGSSLTDHLMWQLSLQTDDALLREIGSAIIGNLDDDGYLVASLDELAGDGRRGRSSRRRAGADAGPELRPDRRRRPRSPGVPAAAAPPPRSRRHAHREDRRPSTCGCCRTTRCRRSRASSGSRSTT